MAPIEDAWPAPSPFPTPQMDPSELRNPSEMLNAGSWDGVLEENQSVYDRVNARYSINAVPRVGPVGEIDIPRQ